MQVTASMHMVQYLTLQVLEVDFMLGVIQCLKLVKVVVLSLKLLAATKQCSHWHAVNHTRQV